MPYLFGNWVGDKPPTTAEQLAQAKLNASSMPNNTNAQNTYARLQNESDAIGRESGNAAAAYAPYQQVVANQQGILNNSQQRLNDVRNDPMDALFQDAVKKQLDTKGLESALFSQGSDMSTAADANRQADIAAGISQRGGNLNDPSARAAMAASTSQRQQDQQANGRNAILAGYQQGQAGLQSGLAYSTNRNNQLNTATGMVNSALSMPVIQKPTLHMTNISPEDADAAAQNGMAASKPTGVGFSAAMPTYNDWLKTQKKV